MNAWPTHEPQHHGERRDYRENQGKADGCAPHGGQGFIGRNACWDPYQWKERVEGPDKAALLAGCEKAGQDRCSRAIEDIRIVEARGEVGEDAKERDGATRETETTESDDGASSHGTL